MNSRAIAVVLVVLAVVLGGAAVYLLAGMSGATRTTATSSTVTGTTTVASTTSSTASTAAKPFAITILNGTSNNQNSPGYSPPTVTLVIGVNSTVTWTNSDVTIHTVTSMGVPTGAKSFNSGDLAPGHSFTYSFTVAGTYTYHCEIHPWMKGTIVVKG